MRKLYSGFTKDDELTLIIIGLLKKRNAAIRSVMGHCDIPYEEARELVDGIEMESNNESTS